MTARSRYLADLATLGTEAVRVYIAVDCIDDPEAYEIVANTLRTPWPKVAANRVRHQPPPRKEIDNAAR